MSRIPKDMMARLDYFHREVETLFQRLFGVDAGAGFEHEASAPVMDLLETDGEIILRADLPGVKKDDIELHAAPSFLMLRGKSVQSQMQRDCLRVERSFGPFQRMISLPATADTAHIKATLALGVLEVRIPKQLDRRKEQRRIEIT